jgi:hypothetical protein
MGGKIMQTYTRDPFKRCPVCDEKGGLDYVTIPESTLTYVLNGENHTEYLPETKDYSCRNCDAQFILLPELPGGYDCSNEDEEE